MNGKRRVSEKRDYATRRRAAIASLLSSAYRIADGLIHVSTDNIPILGNDRWRPDLKLRACLLNRQPAHYWNGWRRPSFS